MPPHTAQRPWETRGWAERLHCHHGDNASILPQSLSSCVCKLTSIFIGLICILLLIGWWCGRCTVNLHICLLLGKIVFSRFILYSFLWLNNIPLSRLYRILFIHSLVDGHLGVSTYWLLWIIFCEHLCTRLLVGHILSIILDLPVNLSCRLKWHFSYSQIFFYTWELVILC